MEPEKVDIVARGTSATGGADDIHAVVAHAVGRLLNVSADQVQPSATLIALGAQSFDFVDLIFQLEGIYEIAIPRIFLVPDYYTIQTLVSAIRDELARRPGGPGRPATAGA